MKTLFLITIILFFAFMGVVVARGEEAIDWDKLVEAVVQAESGGDPFAVGDNGDSIGLMQISSITMREFNENYINDIRKEPWCETTNIKFKTTMNVIRKYDLYDYAINLLVGKWYLMRLHFHYKFDSIPEILAAYNFGLGNVRKGKEYPASTKRYITKVLTLYNK